MTKSVLSKSLGDLISFTRNPKGISGETSCGKFNITVYNESIVRVQATQDTFDDFSYAVVAQPEPSPSLELSEQADQLMIILKDFSLIIRKNPVRFSFVTHDGRVINEDDSFGTSWNGEQATTYKKLQPGERFIGLGEKTGPLDRKGSGYQNWNTDSYGFSMTADPLYCTTPFYMGIHNHLVYGIFFDNSHKTFFNFGASNDRFSSFCADAGEMNYYFIHRKSLGDIIREYTHLTGRMEMPPLWSLGYQQCRYSYYPDKEVLNVARTFREKAIPADVIVLDIHYMDEFKIFSWNKHHFTDPKTLIQQLKDLGFEVVVIFDPGIKIEGGYHAYEDGKQKDVFLKYPDGTYYSGQVWPGWCHFPDFTNPVTREWWKEQSKLYTDLGISGFWNDMNEIATWGNMVPENIEFDFEGAKGTMRKGRNIYGMQMARSTYEGAKALLKGKRPFNLTRAGFSGVQRYAAVWTGDNVSYDEHMMLGVRMISNMGLAGIAFAGYDVGGFVGEASAKLFARWIAVGAFAPFYRGHTMINTRDSEPWSYGEEVEQIARNYIKFRYQLMPYIYSLFHEASETGMPVQRSLALEFPHDHRVYDGKYYNQYFFGPAFLVCPVESTKDLVKIFLPEGDWYYLYSGEKYSGNTEIILDCPLNKLPVFVRASAIVPMQPAKNNTGEKTDLLLLHIYAGQNNQQLEYYEDDGSTYQYKEGKFHKRLIHYKSEERRILFTAAEGKYSSSLKRMKIFFHGIENHGNTVSVNGDTFPFTQENHRFFDPIEKFDPFYNPAPEPEERVLTVELPYIQNELHINF